MLPVDDRQRPVVAGPGGAVSQPGVQAVPGAREGSAVAGGLGAGHDRRPGMSRRLGQRELWPVFRRTPGGARRAWWCGEPEDAIRAQPPEELDGQIGQQEGQPGHVVAGVEYDQDVWIALAPLPGGAGDGRSPRVVCCGGDQWSASSGRAQTHRVQQRGPRLLRPGSSAATKE